MAKSKGLPIKGISSRFYDRCNAFFGYGESFSQRIVDEAALKPGEHVLDCGCGTGTLAIVAKRLVGSTGRVFGVDLSLDQLQIARRKAKERQLQIEFQQASIDDLPYEKASFEVIFSTLMLHHVPTQVKARAFQEMRRVLKPGGRIIIADFGPPASFWGWIAFAPFLFPFLLYDAGRDNMLNRLPDLIKKSGFHVRKHSTIKQFVHLIKAEFP
jgi:ubiquinone/menaquinone biosynthesis C-methylase UbiE